MIMKSILVSLVFIPHLIIGMSEPSTEREKEAESITDEIAVLRKQKEKTAVLSLLTMPKLPLELDWNIYNKLVKFCSYEHAPLIKALLESTLKADCYTRFGEYNQYKVTLFTRAVGYACENQELGMVRLLLEKGANPSAQSLLPSDNQELNMRRGIKYDMQNYMSPLHRVASAVHEERVPLVSLLVEHGADLNVPEYGSTCFMQIVSTYISLIHQTKGPTVNSNKRYELIAKCLSRGAQINFPSECGFGDRCVLTPLQFVKKYQRTELIALFEEHQKKKRNNA
jgi:hypothetical protein